MLAIFLHLGNNDLWDKIEVYFSRIKTTKYDLYVNIMNMDLDLKKKIEEKYQNVKIFNFENRGCDTGAFLLFLNYILKKNIKYEWIMNIHSKTDDKWRNKMLESVIPYNFDNFYQNKILNQTEKKFFSSYIFMYDYFNIHHDIDFSKMLKLKHIYDWKEAEKKYPELKEMNPIEKNIYNNNNNLDKNVLPHIDMELFEYLFGDYKKNHNIISGRDKFSILNNIVKLQKNFKLHYSPGFFFIGKADIFEKYFKNIDIEKFHKELEKGKIDDNLIQSRTHSLERVICFLFQE